MHIRDIHCSLHRRGAVGAVERAPHYFISVVRKVAAADSLPHAKPAALVPPRPQRDEQERTPLLLRSPPLAKLQKHV